MRISDWSSDVCSSDLLVHRQSMALRGGADEAFVERHVRAQAGDFLVALGQRALQALVRLPADLIGPREQRNLLFQRLQALGLGADRGTRVARLRAEGGPQAPAAEQDRKSTRLNSSH